MNKKNLMAKISFLIACCSSSNIYAPCVIVAEPGVFSIGGPLNWFPSSPNDAIIQITSGDVLLDLGGNVITQGNLVTPCDGIVVSPGLTNVTIRNGQIQAITGTGVGIGYGCSNITIDNISTLSCDLRALSCNGVQGAQINGVMIHKFNAGGCGEGITADYAMSFNQCMHVSADSIRIINCGYPTHNYSGLALNVVSGSVFSNVVIDFTLAMSICRGFDLTAVTDSRFTGLACRGGTVLPNGTTIGYDLQNSCTHVSIGECIALSQTAAGPNGTAIGFRIQQGNDSNLMLGCRTTNQSAATATGFWLMGTLSGVRGCLAHTTNSTLATGTAIGFALSNATDVQLLDCISIDHMSSGTAMGFSIDSCTDCLAEHCIAANIDGANDSQTYGFFYTNNAASRCAFTQNIASRNGSSGNSANQFYGFNSFSNTVVDVVTSGPGNISAPWTNIGLI